MEAAAFCLHKLRSIVLGSSLLVASGVSASDLAEKDQQRYEQFLTDVTVNSVEHGPTQLQSLFYEYRVNRKPDSLNNKNLRLVVDAQLRGDPQWVSHNLFVLERMGYDKEIVSLLNSFETAIKSPLMSKPSLLSKIDADLFFKDMSKPLLDYLFVSLLIDFNIRYKKLDILPPLLEFHERTISRLQTRVSRFSNEPKLLDEFHEILLSKTLSLFLVDDYLYPQALKHQLWPFLESLPDFPSKSLISTEFAKIDRESRKWMERCYAFILR